MKVNKEKNCTYSMGLHDHGYDSLIETGITFDATSTDIKAWGWLGISMSITAFILLIIILIIYL